MLRVQLLQQYSVDEALAVYKPGQDHSTAAHITVTAPKAPVGAIHLPSDLAVRGLLIGVDFIYHLCLGYATPLH